MALKARALFIELVTGSDKELYSEWYWEPTGKYEGKTAKFQLRWDYLIKHKVHDVVVNGKDMVTVYDDGAGYDWIKGSVSEVGAGIRNSTYTIPDNAVKIRFMVRPISKTYKKDKKDTYYFSADWSNYVYFDVKSIAPTLKPSPPTIEVSDNKLRYKASVSIDVQAAAVNGITHIQFREGYANGPGYENGSKITLDTRGQASFSFNMGFGECHKVCCRVIDSDGQAGPWSDYTDYIYSKPSPISSFSVELDKINPNENNPNEARIKLAWTVPTEKSNAFIPDKTVIQYVVGEGNNQYFDTNTNNVPVQQLPDFDYKTNHITNTSQDLTMGTKYYFRIRTERDGSYSNWVYSEPFVLNGQVPERPTIWSSIENARLDNEITLSWMHNSKDGSKEKEAKIFYVVHNLTGVYINLPRVITIPNDSVENTGFRSFTFTALTTSVQNGIQIPNNIDAENGYAITWWVQTKGAYSDYSKSSESKTIRVYSEPSLSIISSNIDSNEFSDGGELTSYPFNINIRINPPSQNPTSMAIQIVSTQEYERTNADGDDTIVHVDEVVYSKVLLEDLSNDMTLQLQPYDLLLENNVIYKIVCSASLNSGLSASSERTFTTAFTDENFIVNADTTYNEENFTAYIAPYATHDVNGESVDKNDVKFSIYRINSDNSLTLIEDNISAGQNINVVDPHPNLDYARYRIVGIALDNGSISYANVSEPIGESAIIINWDETFTDFFSLDGEDGQFAKRPYSGNILRLPYDIEISDNHSNDVSLVEYIGRQNPVSYYGTQKSHTSTWNTKIPKDDTETLAIIKKLAVYSGDCYVREPSGDGYWANVKVSYSQKYDDLTIPISLSITKVEGGE